MLVLGEVGFIRFVALIPFFVAYMYICSYIVPDFPWRVGISYLECRRFNEGAQTQALRVNINMSSESSDELRAVT